MTPRRLTFGGWAAFSLSGIFFIVSAVRSADPWAFAGSIVWLIGVTLFVLAMLRS